MGRVALVCVLLWLQPASIRDWPDYKHRMNGIHAAAVECAANEGDEGGV